MLWIIERIIERLFLKSALQMSSQKEAEMELAHVGCRAELLRRAKELEEEKVPGFDQLAATLRNKAAEMEDGGKAPGADVLRIAEELQLGAFQNGNGKATSRPALTQEKRKTSLTATGGRKRGRPRKHPLPDSTGREHAES